MSDERETLELDVVFVGAGPASLAGAYHLARLARQNGLELSIGVLEKGREITSHALSGAVVDPRALKELFPDDWETAPFEGKIEGEKVLWMTERKAVSIPVPPLSLVPAVSATKAIKFFRSRAAISRRHRSSSGAAGRRGTSASRRGRAPRRPGPAP